MPPYTLTSAEKAALRRKYLANIRLMNEYLPEAKKLRPDLKWFNSRVNDKSEQRFYKKSLEISQSVKKREQTAIDIGEKLNATALKEVERPLDRGMYTRLIASDHPKAQKYNRYIIEQYHKNPDAFTQERLQKLMKFNPGDLQKFYKSTDLKNYLLDFYEQNEEVIEDGFQLKKICNEMGNKITPELKANVEAIAGNYETMITAATAARMVVDDGFFTYPPINQDLLDELDKNGFEEEHKDVYNSMKDCMNNIDTYIGSAEQFKKTMEGFDKAGVDLDEKGAFNKYVGFIDEKDKKNVLVSPALHFAGGDEAKGENFQLKTIKDEYLPNIKKVFKKDYIKETNFKLKEQPDQWTTVEMEAKQFRKDFVYAHALRTGQDVGKVDTTNLGEMAESIKGYWKERILNTTSREYKNFIAACKDFDNPNSGKYLSYMEVYRAGNDYLIHKGVKEFEDIAKLPYPANERAMLCWETMDAFEKQLKPTEDRLIRGTNYWWTPKKDTQTWAEKQKAIFDPKEVSDDPLGEIVIKEEPANIKDVNNKITKKDAEDFIDDDADELNDLLDGIGKD